MLTDWHEDLAGHVAALLRAGSLIFNVNSGGTLLDEQLRELHDGRKAAVAGIGIGNDGTQKVCVGELASFGFRGTEAFFSLFPVVEKLCHPQMLNLVRDCCLVGV